MKIAILSPFYPYRGGIAQFSAMLYKSLEKTHQVKAFSFSRLYPDFLFPGKTQYVSPEDGAIPIDSKRILDSIHPFSYQKTAKAIEKFQPDVVIIAYWMSFFAPAYAYIVNRLKKKTKIITLLHNAIPHEARFFDKALLNLLIKNSQGFMIMSESVKENLLSIKPDAHYCLKPHPLYDHFGEKISTQEAREKLEIDPDKKTLLFFGLIRDYKGLDLLIETMSILDDSYQLVIAGEVYGSFEKYEKLIHTSKAKNRIHVFNRYIDDKEVPILFSAADCLVLPYKSATQSGVIPVAYHFAIPIVATDVGSLKATIANAGTGVICQPKIIDLVCGIDELFSMQKTELIANIQKEKENLSWDNFSNALIEFSSTTSF
jgi:glycosyltransferase involved in cell wall biosynthesis